ncbi:hypothetical protein B7P33_04285 [Sediminicola luteus]|uniref:Uncharacterized protein n=1 Tax=Sediminicola luteus TaxID=319238 RepID=A0A2A4GDM7_9FLAO|nr:hypothetical protein B7P33_04285 [Sediminicola luteus]
MRIPLQLVTPQTCLILYKSLVEGLVKQIFGQSALTPWPPLLPPFRGTDTGEGELFSFDGIPILKRWN